MIDFKFKDYSEKSEAIKLEKMVEKFVDFSLTKIMDIKKELSFFIKEESFIYSKENGVLQCDYSLLNNFNVEFLSSQSYIVPLLDIEWKTGENKEMLFDLVIDMIHKKIDFISESEGDMPIISELSKNFDNVKEYIKENEEDIKNKNLFLVYVPYIESDSLEYKTIFIESLKEIILKRIYFINNKKVIFVVNSNENIEFLEHESKNLNVIKKISKKDNELLFMV